mmetsp:Transcript_95703/g.166184  ORF Transcript_95703/g.166184 Transcript_95703/m.166184 type:complete len:324 (+) Transcript_95703:42-1013(+)
MSAAPLGQRTPSSARQPLRTLPRPGDNVGNRLTADDVRKGSFHRGELPVQKPPHQKKIQKRVGIRLSKRSKGKENTTTEWLVPPHLMAATMISVDNGDVKNKVEVRQILKEPWPRKRARPRSCTSSVSSDSDSSDSSDSDSTSSTSSSEESSSSSGLQSPNRTVIAVKEKQSGVIGVNWCSMGSGGWKACYNENGKRRAKRFPLSRYKTADRTWEYADAKALKEAIKCRQRKTREGMNVNNVTGRRAARVSGVRGVTWYSRNDCWIARIACRGKMKSVGAFYPLNETEDAVEEARLAAVAARQRAEAKYYQIHMRSALRSGGA